MKSRVRLVSRAYASFDQYYTAMFLSELTTLSRLRQNRSALQWSKAVRIHSRSCEWLDRYTRCSKRLVMFSGVTPFARVGVTRSWPRDITKVERLRRSRNSSPPKYVRAPASRVHSAIACLSPSQLCRAQAWVLYHLLGRSFVVFLSCSHSCAILSSGSPLHSSILCCAQV